MKPILKFHDSDRIRENRRVLAGYIAEAVRAIRAGHGVTVVIHRPADEVAVMRIGVSGLVAFKDLAVAQQSAWDDHRGARSSGDAAQ